MTTVNEVNNDKTKVPDEKVFPLFVLLLNSMSKLSHNRCTYARLLLKTTAAYVYVHKQLGLCFYVLVCYLPQAQ